MFLQHESVNSWKRNMNKSRATRKPKKFPLPRSMCVPEANGSISSEAKSQSSIISIKISNERENVVIDWYRNNKPFNNRLQPGLNMSKRQSAGGGGCRSVEIKRSYPCLKCKQLNRICECAKFRDMYRKIYGPTTDETILVGMETLHNLVSSRCSDSQSSVKAVEGTVHQQRQFSLESGAPRNAKPSDYNYKRDTGNNGGRGRMPRDSYNDRTMDDQRNKARAYPSGSDEANIELLELTKNQSPQSRKWNDEKPRRDSRKWKCNYNDGRAGNKKAGAYDENSENARRQQEDSFNKEICEDDDETASVYSEISKFVSSDGITNDLHSDASRLSLESRYTVENSVSSIDSKMTAQNPSPLVSADSVEQAETAIPDTDTNNAAAISKHSSLSDSPMQTDNGTTDTEEIAQNDFYQHFAPAQAQDNNIKRTLANVEHSSVHRIIDDLVKQVPCTSAKHHWEQQNSEPEQEQIHETDTTSSEETKDDTAEDSDATEYRKPSTQLYTCLVNPIKNVKTIPVITRFVVPVWDRDKPYPTVHFISSVKDLTSMRADANMQKSCPARSKKHTDLVEYLLNPMRYLNTISHKDNDSLRRSKSDSSLSVSSVHSTCRLFSEATTNIIRQDNFCLTEDELNSICSRDVQGGNRIYIYDTGQTYLPTPKPMFGKGNNIGEKLYNQCLVKNDKATSDSAKYDSVSNPVESFGGEISDDEHNDMSFSTSSSNICTNSITEENNVPQYNTQALAESSNDAKNTEDTEHNKTKNEIYLQLENRQNDTSKSPSNTSTKLKDNDGSIMEERILSLSSLQSSCNSKTNTSTSCTETTSNSEYNTELLRELNAIANDKTAKQVLTPIQEETETSETESSCTENKSNLEQNTVTPKISTVHVKVEPDNIVKTNLVQRESSLSTHGTLAMDNSLTKQENDKMEENIDVSESSPETVSHLDEIITIKQAPNNFDFASSAYSPVPTTCSCFTICHGDADDDYTKSGKKKELNDKQINTRPVRLKRESKSQQTDPVKLRPIKSKGETSSGFSTSARTTSLSTDTVPVRRTKRRSTGTMSKSRKSSTKSQSIKFERKSSKEDAYAAEVTSECLDSVTADEPKSKETTSDDQNMGDGAKSEQKLPTRNLQAHETRYAIARITKYDEFTTYEILKSTRAKPRIIPQTTEGVFTVRNRKKRKLKF